MFNLVKKEEPRTKVYFIERGGNTQYKESVPDIC